MQSAGYTLMDRPGYLPIKKAAAWAGVSSKTIQRWTRRGLPRYQAGPRDIVLIKLSDIDQFLTRKNETVDLDALVSAVLTDLHT